MNTSPEAPASLLWRHQRKPMTHAELIEEARLMGLGVSDLALHAYGMWSRVIVIGQDDPKDDSDPMWSAGLYTGKIRDGSDLRDDPLPAGLSARDVAILRADQNAIRQSQLLHLPLDAHSLRRLRHAAQTEERDTRLLQHGGRVVEEADGDALYAAAPDVVVGGVPLRYENGTLAVNLPAKAKKKATAQSEDIPYEGGEPETASPPQRQPSKTGVAPACPECHAPEGAPHATRCSRRTAQAGTEKFATGLQKYMEDLSKAEVDFGMGEAKEEEPEEEADEFDAYSNLIHNPDVVFGAPASGLIARFTAAHKDSPMEMKSQRYGHMAAIIDNMMEAEEGLPLHNMVLSALCGTRIDSKHLPGLKLEALYGMLKKPDDFPGEMDALRQISDACRLIHADMQLQEA